MQSKMHITNHNGPVEGPARPKFTRRIAVTTFAFDHPTAVAICVAGSFNDWRPGAAPMIAVGAGRWIKPLVLPPGTYEYRFVVDGQWMPDPRAGETAQNPFGELNSILRVPGRNGSD